MTKNTKFEEKLHNKLTLFNSDKIKYEDRVTGFNISPSNLEYYWQNKDEQKEILSMEIDVTKDDGTPETIISPYSPTIKNSPGNRTPNWSDKQKRRDKVIYLIASICYVRDYNILPVSSIINRRGDLQFNYLLAKDRGTFNYYFTQKDELLDISFWSKVKEILNRDYSHKFKIKKVIERIDELIKNNKTFSIREAIPNDIWNDWYNDEDFIVVRIKFEDYKSHKDEMDRFNNNPNPWVEHNHIMNSSIIPLIIENPNTYNETMLDSIYDYAKVEPLFKGELKQCNNPAPQKSVEEYEGFIPWLFTSLRLAYPNDVESIISVIARSSEQNLNKKKKAYESAFKSGVGNFKESIDYLVLLAGSTAVETFSKKFSKWITEKYVNTNTPKKNQKLNITELSLEKWDTFFTCATLIYFLTNKIHGDRANIERYNDIATIFFDNAHKMLLDSELGTPSPYVVELETANNTLSNKYESFWKKVYEKALDAKTKEINGKLNANKFYDMLENDLCNKGFSTKQVYVYDRVSSTQFELFLISFESQNMQEGHKIPTDAKTYGNVVLQLPKDNKYNNNKPITDIDEYIKTYMNELDNWVKANDIDDITAIIKTKIVLESWKNQIKIAL
jgi:hypothetical protein